jgi:hypothetical protein
MPGQPLVGVEDSGRVARFHVYAAFVIDLDGYRLEAAHQ